MPSSASFSLNPQIAIKFRNLMAVAMGSLPEHRTLFNFANNTIGTCGEARPVILHLLQIISIEKQSDSLVKEMKIFASAEEKMKQAASSFQSEDYVSTFNNLNTSFRTNY